jgi:anti-anti-sigma regulatory factor
MGRRGRRERVMLDGAADGNGAASEPMVTVLDGPLPGARLLRLVRALDEAAGQALQRVAADVLAGVPPFVLVDLSVVDAVTTEGVAALVVVAEKAGEADIGLAVVAGDGPRTAFVESGVEDLFELYATVEQALKAT